MAEDLYAGETVSFDEDGNLLMTTRDKAATSAVRYKTIGWIIKKSYGDGAGNRKAYVTLEQSGPSVADPYQSGYIYTYFKCDSETVKNAFDAADAEWAAELYEKGGFVYLDAIMTVVENGVQTGERYTTFEGIRDARSWADKEALRTHYNKILYFYPQKKESEKTKTEKVTYGEKENETDSFMNIKAKDEFDVITGIPTSEAEFAKGKLQKCLYYTKYEKVSGNAAVPVDVTIYRTVVIETDDGPISTVQSSTYTAYSSKSYQYYKIPELKFYALESCTVKNYSLPGGKVTLKDLYKPKVIIKQDRGEYLKIGRGSVTVNADTFTGDLSALIDASAPEPRVRNDEFIIDGETVMDGSWYVKKAPEYKDLTGSRLVNAKSKVLTIPNTKKNGVYNTQVTSAYKLYGASSKKTLNVSNTNPVMVHTPTFCDARISDDRAHNQEINPTKLKSLVLGRDFTVSVSTKGNHKPAKGYGLRDYAKYTLKRQVKFPFEVYKGNALCPANSWITLSPETESFYLPLGVREGDYTVSFRSIAINADAAGADYKEQHVANLSEAYHGAYETIGVTVTGSLFDFEITDIVDYPRWKNVFYSSDGKKNGFTFKAARIPVLKGDNAIDEAAGPVKLGYRVKYRLKTTGNMTEIDDAISLDTQFFFVSGDGKTKIPVKLYSSKDLKEVHPKWTLSAKNRSFQAVNERNVSDENRRKKSIQLWEGEFYISPDTVFADSSVNLEELLQKSGGKIKRNDPVFLKDGYLIVNLDIKSADGGVTHLSYINPFNSKSGYCNRLKAEGFKNKKTDSCGITFDFADGDLLVFDVKNTIYSDYDSVGTH
ncbi:MAG: DUF5704 domain-containing protein [Lachnospiraceae bacterium]|nr:DUF5704 domain-containing protein [Lachnospiraceae bacterium]